MLKDKTVILAVTGSIAAYKIANLASMLKKLNCNVHVLMTENARNFVNPITFETLTGNKCLVDTFDRNFEYSVEHVSLAKQADLAMVAPATANVTLISGKTSISPPSFVKLIDVDSAKEMFEVVAYNYADNDIIIMAAAVADYTPKVQESQKIKKQIGDSSIKLTRTDDILEFLGKNKKENQFLCGFSMETENLIENSTRKLESKNADLIVANNLNVSGAGFGTDTNVVTFITKEKTVDYPIMSKDKVAEKIIDFILKRRALP